MSFQGRSPSTLPDCDSLSHLIYHIPFTLSTYCVYYLWKVKPSSLYKRPHLRISSLFSSECLFILETQTFFPSACLFILRNPPCACCFLILISYPSLALYFSLSSDLISLSLSISFHPQKLNPLSFPQNSPLSTLCMPLHLQNSSLLILHVSSSSYRIPLSLSIFLYPRNSSIFPSPCPFTLKSSRVFTSACLFILRKSAFFSSACCLILRTRPSLPLQVSPSSELVIISLCTPLHLKNSPLSSSTCLFIFSESPLSACHSPTHSCPE